MTRPHPFLTEPQWHQRRSLRLCPPWLQESSYLPFSFSWRSFTMSKPLQPGVRLLRRLCHPSHPLALSRPRTRQGGIGLPKFRGVRRLEVPLGACYRPGASGITYRYSSTIGTKHHPFWVRCISHFHLFGFTIFHPQISLVTIGTRSGRSTGLWLQVAELLSLGFPPSRVPLVNAGQLDLTPLFMCSSLCEQSIRHVKWHGPLNPGESANFGTFEFANSIWSIDGDRLKTDPEACWQVDTFSGHLTGVQPPQNNMITSV